MDYQESPRTTLWLRSSWAALGLASLAFVAWVAWARGAGAVGPLLLFVLTMVVFGKLTIFAGIGDQLGLGLWELALLSFVVDLHLSFLVMVGLGAIERRSRRLGGWIVGMRRRAATTLRTYPGLRRLAFAGVALFVILPLAGTGPIGGSFVARLIGLPRFTAVLAVGVGSAVASASYAALGDWIGTKGRGYLENPWIVLASLALAVAVVWLAWILVRRELRRA